MVKEITIVLENCEAFTVNADSFGAFLIDDIHVSVSRCACNTIDKCVETKDVLMQISKKENTVLGGWYDDGTTLFQRLVDGRDITQLLVAYEDGSEERYYVDYDEGESQDVFGAPNINQIAFVSEQGNLWISIKKDRTPEALKKILTEQEEYYSICFGD